MKKLNDAGPHYRVLPEIMRRQWALKMPTCGHVGVIRAKWLAPAAQRIFLLLKIS